MDRLTSMEVFVRAVEAGSFARAAEALGLSPQGVGKHVRGLEDRLGVRLINRTTRRQGLTDFGRDYYERVRTVLAEIEAAESLAAERNAVPRGRLRINAPVTFGAHELAPVMPRYMAAYPEVNVELALSNRYVDLVDEGFDLVFRTGALADSGLIARRLRPMRLALCAAPGYLERHPAPGRPADLLGHECLGFAHGAIRDRWSFVGPAKPTPAVDGAEDVEVRHRLVADNGQALLALAVAGLGVLMQPAALVREALAEGRLVGLLPEYEPSAQELHLLYAPDRRITPKLRTFVDFAVAEFGG